MKKFENFKSALSNLKDIYSCHEPYRNVEIAGIILINNNFFERTIL